MDTRPYATPLVIASGKTSPLLRVEFSDLSRDEDWLQTLLFDHAELLPFEELDPLFRNSIPVAREVETGVGPVDIVYVNSDGLLTLVETKLWRNPEARREVVAQLINYAAAVSKMTYRDLSREISDSRHEEGRSLFDVVRDQIPTVNEQRFHDSVSSNLRAGRFLLLVVGDGIREDVEEMSEYLYRYAGMGFTLRLVEMTTYRLPGEQGSLIVVPQIVARTREVVRAVVEVRNGQIHVETPQEPTKSPSGRYRITPEQYFNELAQAVDQQTLDSVRWVLSESEKHELNVEWMQSGPVFKYYNQDADVSFTMGQFDRYGDFTQASRFQGRVEELELADSIWHDYFSAVAVLIPGAKIKQFKSKVGNEWNDLDYTDVKADTTLPSLLRDREKWLKVVDATIVKLKDALKQRKK